MHLSVLPFGCTALVLGVACWVWLGGLGLVGVLGFAKVIVRLDIGRPRLGGLLGQLVRPFALVRRGGRMPHKVTKYTKL